MKILLTYLILCSTTMLVAQDIVNVGSLDLQTATATESSELLFLDSENKFKLSNKKVFENRVSITGDTLFFFGTVAIIPGISMNNLPSAQVLRDLGYTPREIVNLGKSPESLRGVTYQDGVIIDYDTLNSRGIIAATMLIGNSAGNAFGCSGVALATQNGLYEGEQNSINIMAGCPSGTAADVANAYQSTNFNDWYLPSTLEIARARGLMTAPSTYSYRYVWTSYSNVTSDFTNVAAYAWDSQSFNSSNDYPGRFRTESTNFAIWPMRIFTD